MDRQPVKVQFDSTPKPVTTILHGKQPVVQYAPPPTPLRPEMKWILIALASCYGLATLRIITVYASLAYQLFQQGQNTLASDYMYFAPAALDFSGSFLIALAAVKLLFRKRWGTAMQIGATLTLLSAIVGGFQSLRSLLSPSASVDLVFIAKVIAYTLSIAEGMVIPGLAFYIGARARRVLL